MMDDEQLLHAFKAEMLALSTDMPHIELMIRPADAWILLSFLQLALRHPQAASTESARDARRLALRLQELIAKPGSAMEIVANKGWAGE